MEQNNILSSRIISSPVMEMLLRTSYGSLSGVMGYLSRIIWKVVKFPLRVANVPADTLAEIFAHFVGIKSDTLRPWVLIVYYRWILPKLMYSMFYLGLQVSRIKWLMQLHIGSWRVSNAIYHEVFDHDLEELTLTGEHFSLVQEIQWDEEFRAAVALISATPNAQIPNPPPVMHVVERDNIQQLAVNHADTPANETVDAEVHAIPPAFELAVSQPDPAPLPVVRRRARRYRASRVVAILRARVRIKFGIPKYTEANVHAVRIFLGSQEDVVKTIEAVPLAKIFERVMYYAFTPTRRELELQMAMRSYSYMGVFDNSINTIRELYHAYAPSA